MRYGDRFFRVDHRCHAGVLVCAFWFARFVLRDSIQHRYGDKLKRINASFEREGAFYLFTLRLVPAFPFFLVNLVMGLTPIRILT